ncbi:hypothetical protein [Allopseudospirillum japonicum]|nr:hypothetical protein [Allopseudospirillum japonicum]
MAHLSQETHKAYYAANTGIDYAIAWLSEPSHQPNWQYQDQQRWADLQISALGSGAQNYQVNIQYQQQYFPKISPYIFIKASAYADNQSHIKAQQSIWVTDKLPLLNEAAKNIPPIINHACIETESVYPGFNQQGEPLPYAYASANTECVHQQHQFISDLNDPWSYLVNARLDRETYKKLAQQESVRPVSARRFFYVDAAKIQQKIWQPEAQVLGTPEQQVFIYFPAQAACPKLQNVTLYALVFIEGDCDASQWQQVEIVGALVVNGKLNNLNKQTEIYSLSHHHLGATLEIAGIGVHRILGSWRDF